MTSTGRSGTRDSPLPPPSDVGSRVGEGETLRHVKLPGCTLAVRGRSASREVGTGSSYADLSDHSELPPALYVHGLGGSSLNWSALMAELEGTVDGEAVDLPGFGDSPPPDDGGYTLHAHTRAVIRYLDARRAGPVHLFGNSLGGAVSTRVAALRPDLVRTLTLVSPALPELRPQRTAWPTGLLALPGSASTFRWLTRDWGSTDRVRSLLGLCYGDPRRVNEEDFAYAVAEYERRQRLPYFWHSLTASARSLIDSYTVGGQHAPWKQAARVLAPTLLVYGGRDKLVSFRMARKACRVFRDSRLLTLPDAGHVAMMEYPEVVAGGFRQLLAESERAGVETARGTS